MKKLQQIVAFLCMEYPHKSEITKARLTKMVYLADWFSALINGKQITDIEWVFNHYGPYVDDIVNAIQNTSDFNFENANTMYGSSKVIISYIGDGREVVLNNLEKRILKTVVEKTKNMYFNDFINYVYSTYPVKTKERYSTLDLVALAKKYKEENVNKVS